MGKIIMILILVMGFCLANLELRSGGYYKSNNIPIITDIEYLGHIYICTMDSQGSTTSIIHAEHCRCKVEK